MYTVSHMIVSIIYLSLGSHSEQLVSNVIPTNSVGKLNIQNILLKSIKLIVSNKNAQML